MPRLSPQVFVVLILVLIPIAFFWLWLLAGYPGMAAALVTMAVSISLYVLLQIQHPGTIQ